MESMTGYGFFENITDQFSFSVEIKSLNSKYLETFINIPKVLKNEENEILQLLKKSLNRGKIVLNIEIFDWQYTKPLSVNSDILKRYFSELQEVKNSLGVKEDLRFESLLAMDGITQRERSVISEKSREIVFATINRAIKKTIEMRKKEGVSIKKDIQKNLSEIVDSVKDIKRMSKHSVTDKSNKLKKRIEEIAKKQLDENRFYTEIAILADKIDINEEIVRLTDHIKKMREILKENGQVGKKVDFLSQEFFREINTIASKSSSSEISHKVVDVKNYIDKVREQARNII